MLALLSASWVTGPAAGAVLEADPPESKEGYFQLRWDAAEPVRLMEATDPEFSDARLLYSGGDTARVISGKPDGTWFYRIEANAGQRELLADPIAVTVRHHSLRRAWTFFGIGGVVFAATLALILLARPEDDERKQ